MSQQLRRIMFVEDDPDIAFLAVMALQDIGGFELFHFGSGKEALEHVQDVDPDLVILDYSMPGMNGDEVLAALRSRPETKHIPVLFMTASVMPAHVSRLKALGAIEVLRKPFDPLQLSEQVRRAWESAG